MTIRCPSCGTQLRIGDEHAGKMLKCPKCQGQFQAPAAVQSQPTADPLDQLPSATSPPRPTTTRRPMTRGLAPRKSKAPAIIGVIAVIVVIGIIRGVFSGGGTSPSGLSLQEFKTKLREISYFPDLQGRLLVVSKKKLIDTFGKPERVAQAPSGKMEIYYQIADGMAEIESTNHYWNGERKYTYQGDAKPRPKHPLASKLEPHIEGGLRQLHGAAPNRVEYNRILVDWYLQTHQNPYKVVGPDKTGRYRIQKNGKHRYVGGIHPEDRRKKATLEACVPHLLAEDAQAVLNEQLRAIEKEHRERNRKTIEEPCFLVMSIRVF